MERTWRHAPYLLLAVAMAAAAAMTLVLTAELTFLQDTWEFLISRQELTVDNLLRPHNEHLVAVPALIQWVLIQLFGMSDPLPEYLVLVAFLLGTAGLLFVYVERRVGPWPALFAAVLLLGFGPGWEALLWPFEITFIGPLFFGIAMLLALEREDGRGDLAACVFLVLALGFSGLGLPFGLAAAVAILQGDRGTWLRRSYVVVIPALLFVIWYLGWGHEAATHISLENILESPRFVAEAVSAATASLVGLGTNPIGGGNAWGPAILVALVVVIAYRQLRRPGFDPGLWPIAAAAAASWFLTAFNAAPGREAASSRYQYVAAVFVLMILANLLRGVRPSQRAIALIGVLTLVALGPNLVVLAQGRDTLKQQAVLTQADTAAIEIAGRSVDPAFRLTPDLAGTTTLIDVAAGPYLEAVEDHGSDAYSEAELLAAPDYGRRQADIVLGQALPLSTTVTPGAFGTGASAGCVSAGAAGIPLRPGATRIEVPPGPPAALSLRRFATGEFPVTTAAAPGGSVMVLKVPRDLASQPWRLRVEAAQGARVCPA
ncbi:MAG TPA: hypothetical protein VF255_03265 [Solirubrobacterales bacterium]